MDVYTLLLWPWSWLSEISLHLQLHLSSQNGGEKNQTAENAFRLSGYCYLSAQRYTTAHCPVPGKRKPGSFIGFQNVRGKSFSNAQRATVFKTHTAAQL